jgi:hypothetical protein
VSFTEKVDVLDLLINTLREHEENLDRLVERMETMCSRCPAIKHETEEEEEESARMHKIQDPYAKEFRRQAETFRSLANLVEPKADTEKKKGMVLVARGLAEVCDMLASDIENEEDEP